MSGLKPIPGPLETKCKWQPFNRDVVYELRMYLQCTLYYFYVIYLGRKLINLPIFQKNLTMNKSDNKFTALTHRIASCFCNIAELIAAYECNLVNAFRL